MADTETTDGKRRYLVIQTDRMTGWEARLDNFSTSPWGDTFAREEAEKSVGWRKAHIDSRYGYEIRDVTVWCLDIIAPDAGPADASAVHYALFMEALGTEYRETDPFDSTKVMMRADGKPGGQVWAYTRRGVTSPPEWLVKLCAHFEDRGYDAGIARPVN